MNFIAMINPEELGRAFGIGRSETEAKLQAASDTATSGKLDTLVAVDITRLAYETIMSHGLDAVHFCLPDLQLRARCAVPLTWGKDGNL